MSFQDLRSILINILRVCWNDFHEQCWEVTWEAKKIFYDVVEQILLLYSILNRTITPRPRSPAFIRCFRFIIKRRRRMMRQILIERNPLERNNDLSNLRDLLEWIRNILEDWLMQNRHNIDFYLDYEIYDLIRYIEFILRSNEVSSH